MCRIEFGFCTLFLVNLRFATRGLAVQTLRRLSFIAMPKSKNGSSGAELVTVRAQVKRLKKQLKEMSRSKRESDDRLRMLSDKLSERDSVSAESADEDDSRVDEASAVASCVAQPSVVTQEVTSPKRKPKEAGEESDLKGGPQDPLQRTQYAAEGAHSKPIPTQTGKRPTCGGKDTALQIVVSEKIRRPKNVADVMEQPGFVPPVLNGFIAVRGINRERMFRPTWYFASVKKGEVGIRRKLSKGVVQGIPSCGLDGIEVSEAVQIEALPKVGHKWLRPQTDCEQQQEVRRKSVETTPDPKLVKLPSSPSAGANITGKGGIIVPPITAANNNSFHAPMTVSTSQVGAKTANVSAAQRVSDSSAWDEIKPMLSDALAEEVRAGIRLDQSEVFRTRCVNGPFAAVAQGRFLTTLKLKKDPVQDLASRALAKSTVMSHKRILRALMRLPEKYWELPLDRAMEQYFLDEKVAKRWLPTTTVVKMANAHGALRLLPLYVENELPVLMKESVIWMQAMKAAAKSAKQMPPRQPTAATWSEVATAIKAEPVVSIRMAVLMTWLTFGRGGDVLLLKPSDVVMTSKESAEGVSEGMAVSFWKGKTVKTRGSYTVFTQRPPLEYLEEFESYHNSMRAEQYLFKGVTGAQIKVALRRANTLLEQRSLRRGAIQTVAATGVSDTEMLHYSGHTNVAMLRRYLNFGKLSGEGVKLSRQAAALVMSH